MSLKAYRHVRRMIAAYAVLAIGLVATWLSYQSAKDSAAERDWARFRAETDSALVALLARANHYISALQSLQGFFHADETVTPQKWRRYLPSLVWHREYPNLLLLGYAERVATNAVAGMVEEKARSGWGSFEIRTTGEHEVLFPIVLLESRLADARFTAGFDLGVEPEQRAAMEQARDRSAPMSSGVVDLRATPGNSPSLGQMIYVPVYQGGAEPRALEERREKLRGFVFGAFSAADLYRDTLRRETNQVVELEVTEVAASEPGKPAGDPDVTVGSASGLTRTIVIAGMGKWWQMRFTTLPTFAADSQRRMPPLILGSGLALTFMFFAIAWVQTGGRTRAEELNAELEQRVHARTAELREANEELQASAERLRQSEKRFSSTFHASPVMISLARLSDGVFVEVNESFRQMTGYSGSQVIGRTATDLDLWADACGRREFVGELRERGFARDAELLLRTGNGELRTVLLSAEVIEVEREPFVLEAGIDITSRKQAEEELCRTLAREKELSELKSDFVATVSHEFRTPLGIILSSTEILERYLNRLAPERRADHLQAIRKAVQRMAGLMEEVLLFGEVEAGPMKFKPAPMDLAGFCGRVTEELMSATGRRCPIEFSVGPLTARAWGDENLMRQVVTQLLSNAVKYSAAGSPVSLSVRQSGELAVLRVEDRGMGIPAGDRDRLFKAFQRGRNVGRISGTGLGLALVKRCVELHCGKVEVESVEGKGTAFTVRLPLFGAPGGWHDPATGENAPPGGADPGPATSSTTPKTTRAYDL